ncbi:MAG: HAD family phosphatase [Alistipes sp.]|nr:HAD family phosphatase [Alistipes sp.]
MLKSVIFDMDGVLVNNMPVHMKTFEIFFGRYGVERWQERIAECYGMGNDDILDRLMPDNLRGVKSLREWGAEKEALYRELYSASIEPHTGLVPLLEALNNEGITCAVGSSACLENVEFVLEHCHIGGFFDVRICGDDVTRCKPDPEIYLTAAKRLGNAPDECLVFEDAKAGIEAAQNAGMKVVALTTSFQREIIAQTGADIVIDDFTQIDTARLKQLF